jgi:hypothetical protein
MLIAEIDWKQQRQYCEVLGEGSLRYQKVWLWMVEKLGFESQGNIGE